MFPRIPRESLEKASNSLTHYLQVGVHLETIFFVTLGSRVLRVLNRKFQVQRNTITTQFIDRKRDSQTPQWQRNLQITKGALFVLKEGVPMPITIPIHIQMIKFILLNQKSLLQICSIMPTLILTPPLKSDLLLPCHSFKSQKT